MWTHSLSDSPSPSTNQPYVRSVLTCANICSSVLHYPQELHIAEWNHVPKDRSTLLKRTFSPLHGVEDLEATKRAREVHRTFHSITGSSQSASSIDSCTPQPISLSLHLTSLTSPPYTGADLPLRFLLPAPNPLIIRSPTHPTIHTSHPLPPYSYPYRPLQYPLCATSAASLNSGN